MDKQIDVEKIARALRAVMHEAGRDSRGLYPTTHYIEKAACAVASVCQQADPAMNRAEFLYRCGVEFDYSEEED